MGPGDITSYIHDSYDNNYYELLQRNIAENQFSPWASYMAPHLPKSCLPQRLNYAQLRIITRSHPNSRTVRLNHLHAEFNASKPFMFRQVNYAQVGRTPQPHSTCCIIPNQVEATSPLSQLSRTSDMISQGCHCRHNVWSNYSYTPSCISRRNKQVNYAQVGIITHIKSTCCIMPNQAEAPARLCRSCRTSNMNTHIFPCRQN